jgi:hypothetical protein
VRTILAVVDREPAIAASTASTELGVELFQNPRRNLAAERSGVARNPAVRQAQQLVALEPYVSAELHAEVLGSATCIKRNECQASMKYSKVERFTRCPIKLAAGFEGRKGCSDGRRSAAA